MAKTEDYSIEDLNDIIKRIQEATSFSENQIEAEINRSYGYLSQTRSRGKVPVALYKLLQSTFKDALQNTKAVNGLTVSYKNGNGPVTTGPSVEEIVKAKDETIAVLHKTVHFLEDENKRLQKQCSTSLTVLQHYAQLNAARLKTLVECQKMLTALAMTTKLDKKKIDEASAKVDMLYQESYAETFQDGKD